MPPDPGPARIRIRDQAGSGIGDRPAPVDLAALERWMQAAILAPRSDAHDAAADAALLPTPSLGPAQRLDIYRDMVAARFEGAMRSDFAAVAALLGEEAFARAAAHYLRKHPSRSFTLARLGDGFPAFLDAYPGLPPRRRAAAADLARLERAVDRVAAEPEAAPVAPEEVAAVPADAWPEAVLVPVPHLALETFGHDVLPAYRAFAGGEVPAVPERRASTVAILRRGGGVRLEPLTPEEGAFLGDLRAGVPLGTAVAVHAATPAGPVLERAFAAGLFAAIRLHRAGHSRSRQRVPGVREE